MYRLLRPLFFTGDPESAHARALRWAERARRCGLLGLAAHGVPDLPTQAFGLTFRNPVGLAAGLDKNGAYIDALATFGFGFIEVGTVTPRPQPGNPMPRLFRLPEKQAVINRMGFNNDGIDALVRNVERARWRGVIGVNIGKNKDTPNEDALVDYVHCLERAWDVASYIVVNISSPNTAGLRALQLGEPLRALAGGLREAQERLTAQRGIRRPLLLKIAPDLSEQDIDALGATLDTIGIDGVIATNTTLDRFEVAGLPHAEEAGGLSGAPLYGMSTAVLRHLRGVLSKQTPLIGVGGILSGADAAGKLAAGAALVQCYSGLVYRGPALIGECVEALRRRREQGTTRR
ncbi:quinone-dependent dihydroorotate dehydrogenase [Xanthomonadaceae bacterium XH05]|nr:quinone-dependent dihydroorotate dehydrogenase [Xanthomonadaceae bacterium XH05]